MDQNFSLMAQSRANYYTAGSPVQFVRVELLKGDVTGEVAVCLTFKNVGTEPLTGLVVHFKCKDAAGQVLCEDDFYYEQLNAQPGEVFGSDDAVYAVEALSDGFFEVSTLQLAKHPNEQTKAKQAINLFLIIFNPFLWFSLKPNVLSSHDIFIETIIL